MLIIIAVFLALFLALALWRLPWAVLLIIAALPSYLIRFHIFSFPTTLLEAMILIAFAVWLLRDFFPHLKTIIKTRKERSSYPFRWEIILLVIIALASVGVAGFSLSAFGIWRAYFLEPIFLFILFFNCLGDRTGRERALWALLVSAAVISLFAIFQKVTGLFIPTLLWQAAATRRVVSFFTYPNAVGLFLAPVIMVLTGWLWSLSWKKLEDEGLKKILIVLTIVAATLAVYFAKSWGAIVALAVAGLVFLLFAGRKSRLAALIIILAAVAGFALIKPAREAALEKLNFQGLSGQIRKQQWKETLIMLNHGHFWLGAGLANYQTTIAPYHQPGLFFNYDHLANFGGQLAASPELRAKYWQPVEVYLYPHNIFLNFWSELGLAGALLFVWIIVKYLSVAFKRFIIFGREREKAAGRFLALGLMVAMLVIIIHGVVDVPYFKNDLSVMFWLLVALLYI